MSYIKNKPNLLWLAPDTDVNSSKGALIPSEDNTCAYIWRLKRQWISVQSIQDRHSLCWRLSILFELLMDLWLSQNLRLLVTAVFPGFYPCSCHM